MMKPRRIIDLGHIGNLNWCHNYIVDLQSMKSLLLIAKGDKHEQFFFNAHLLIWSLPHILRTPLRHYQFCIHHRRDPGYGTHSGSQSWVGISLSCNAVLLLDDCDRAVHHNRKELQELLEMISQSSKYVKIVLTSRQPVYFLKGFKKYYLDYFDQNAAVYILEREAEMDLHRMDVHWVVNLVDR